MVDSRREIEPFRGPIKLPKGDLVGLRIELSYILHNN